MFASAGIGRPAILSYGRPAIFMRLKTCRRPVDAGHPLAIIDRSRRGRGPDAEHGLAPALPAAMRSRRMLDPSPDVIRAATRAQQAMRLPPVRNRRRGGFRSRKMSANSIGVWSLRCGFQDTFLVM